MFKPSFRFTKCFIYFIALLLRCQFIYIFNKTVRGFEGPVKLAVYSKIYNL